MRRRRTLFTLSSHEGGPHRHRRRIGEVPLPGDSAESLTPATSSTGHRSTVRPVRHREDVDACWSEVEGQILAALESIVPGQFIIVSQGHPGESDGPYVQCAPDASGLYCEAASSSYLSANEWPIDEVFLRRVGWQLPDAETGNWWRVEVEPAAAALCLTEALRLGRRCEDAAQVVIVTGWFPAPPGGRETLEAKTDLSVAA